jgi:hypothetical protein
MAVHLVTGHFIRYIRNLMKVAAIFRFQCDRIVSRKEGDCFFPELLVQIYIFVLSVYVYLAIPRAHLLCLFVTRGM